MRVSVRIRLSYEVKVLAEWTAATMAECQSGDGVSDESLDGGGDRGGGWRW